MQARALALGVMFYINTIDQFLALYKCLKEPYKNILCELYNHDLIVTGYSGLDHNPYVGDVQIRAFASFMQNQIKWNKSMAFVERAKKIKCLRLRGEHDPIKLLEERAKLMKSAGFATILKNRQKATISSCDYWIALNRLEVVYCIQIRQQHLMYEQEIRELTSLFYSTLDRVQRYAYCLKALGIQWIGLRFHFPVLWENVES